MERNISLVIFRHSMLVKVNTVLDVPIKKGSNFRFDFPGWNVTVILNVKM